MEKEKLIVEVQQGKLLGTVYTSALNEAIYYCFLGIPYAKPPVNHLRFMPPEPPESWKSIRDATKEGDDCLHYSVFHHKLVGSEDCLYLNVYCPQPPCEIEKPKAVIFHIHCGGNNWGSGSSMLFGAPDFIVHHDVIFVAINFRLHVFGFLNLGLPNCAGNMGMKDQVMALRWCRENIQFFGGDPQNITLHGGSSGAADIHFHMLSPLSKGLFHKVILQAGFALSPAWSYHRTQTTPLERAQKLVEFMGHKNVNNKKRLYRILKQKSANEIHTAYSELRQFIKNKNTAFVDIALFTISIEAFEKDAFLCHSPRDLIYTSKPHTPILAGITSLEGFFAFIGNPLEASLREILETNLWVYKMEKETLDIITKNVQKYYFTNKGFGPDAITEICNLYTDMWFAEWQDVLDFEATFNNSPVYLYLFTFNGEGNAKLTPSLGMKPVHGASHAEDLYHVIYMKNFSGDAGIEETPTIFKPSELKVINNLGRIVTNFSKAGDPNGNLSEGVCWQPHKPSNPSYLQIDESLTMRNGLINEERRLFWKNMIAFIKEKEKQIKCH